MAYAAFVIRCLLFILTLQSVLYVLVIALKMVNVILLNFYIASSTTNFILFLVCTAIQNIFWMDRFINAYVIIIIIYYLTFNPKHTDVDYSRHSVFLLAPL